MIYQVKIALQGSEKPPIWRRILITDDITFWDFHLIIQAAMGWWNAHLFVFQPDRDTRIGIPFDDFGEPDDDAKKIKLKKYFNQEGAKMHYEYDFGDGWAHILTLEKILPKDAKTTYPQLIKGKGMCPHEDCGGIWGYYDLIEAVNDPKHDQHEERREWIGIEDGEVLDPAYFDLETQNKELQNWKSNDRSMF